MTTVGGAARVLVRLATAVLPAGASRDRYRREHTAELGALSGAARVRYAVGMLAAAWSLRRAVAGGSATTVPGNALRRPLRCRVNLHHWVDARTPDGHRYRHCDRCGKDYPGGYVTTVDLIGPPGGGIAGNGF